MTPNLNTLNIQKYKFVLIRLSKEKHPITELFEEYSDIFHIPDPIDVLKYVKKSNNNFKKIIDKNSSRLSHSL